MVKQEVFYRDGRWVAHPINGGDAKTYGIELELKTALTEFFKNGPAIDLRSNLNRNWSTVDDVPGPDNRLATQEILNINFGLDWRLKKLPITVGGNYGFKQGGAVRNAINQVYWIDAQRALDAYVLWKLDKSTQLRFSAANLLGQDVVKGEDYFDVNSTYRQTSTLDTSIFFRAALEMTL